MKNLLILMAMLMTTLSLDVHAYAQKTLTFAQFKQLCLNPGQFNAQRPPQKISITCANKVTKWVPAETTNPLDMKTTRTVTTSLISDKAQVRSTTVLIPAEPVVMDCPVMKEVVATIEIEKPVTCKDVVGKNVSLTEFCVTGLDTVITESTTNDLDLEDVVETGRVFKSCENGQQTGKPTQLPKF